MSRDMTMPSICQISGKRHTLFWRARLRCLIHSLSALRTAIERVTFTGVQATSQVLYWPQPAERAFRGELAEIFILCSSDERVKCWLSTVVHQSNQGLSESFPAAPL